MYPIGFEEFMCAKRYFRQCLIVVGGMPQAVEGYVKSEDAINRMEIDFLIQKETVTSRHDISSIEVKNDTD